jgi:hypothetical protein
MSTSVAPTPATAEPARPASPELYRLTVEQYEQMIDRGVLTKNDKVELIEGLLVKKMTKNSPHIWTIGLIREALNSVLPVGWFLTFETPVLLARSEPEPDIMVMRGRVPDYFGRKPAPGDVSLLIEVSDSSLADDRSRAPLFAGAGIPTYWIANIPEQKIEVYTDPADNAYRTRAEYGLDAEVPVVIDGREVARFPVRDLLAPPAQG